MASHRRDRRVATRTLSLAVMTSLACPWRTQPVSSSPAAVLQIEHRLPLRRLPAAARRRVHQCVASRAGQLARAWARSWEREAGADWPGAPARYR